MSRVTVRQIAEALSVAKRSAERRSEREGWPYVEEAGRGGKRRLYTLADLPSDVQAALLKHHPELMAPAQAAPELTETSAAKPVHTYDPDALWDHYERKPEKTKARAQHRLQLLEQAMQLVEGGKPIQDAFRAVGRAHDVPWRTVAGWYYGTNGKPGAWDYARADWLAALVPGYIGRTKMAECSPEAWEFFKAQYLRPEAPNASTCRVWTLQAAREHGWAVPQLRTLQRWVKEIPMSVRVLKREGENALMRLYPAQERTVRDLHAMEWINGDGYQHNVFVRWPDGTVGRPKTWFWQDVHSRRLLGYRTDHTEHSDMIRLALGAVIERHGIPGHATIDNTRAAANKWLTGGVKNRYRFTVREEDPLGILPTLGIKVHWTTVHNGKGHGQAKPVERTFGVGGLGELVDKHPRLAGAYTGPNPTEKPDNYGTRAVDLDVFLAVLAEGVAAFNALPNRRTEICAGQLSFDEAFAQSCRAAQDRIRMPTDAQRRLWLLAAESIRVQPDSTIALQVGQGPQGRNRYQADALINHIGQRLVVRFDPEQLHDTVHCYTLDGRYIGPAECIAAAGFGDSEAGREWRRQLQRRKTADKAAAEAQVSMNALEAAEWMGGVPEPEPEPERTVVRGAFERQPKRAANGDVVPGGDNSEPASGAETYHFADYMQGAWEQWRKDQL